MRILIVSQMWPGPRDPDLGAFVEQVARELGRLGHEVDRAVIDHRGGSKAKYLGLLARARSARPADVVFAHFLVPAGLIGLLAARGPLVVMAHGQDVANAERSRALRGLTKLTVRNARAVIANSEHLAARLERATGVRADAVIDCGVDLERFAPGVEPAPWPVAESGPSGMGGPRFLCVGSLVERKNVVALADAFASLGTGSLVFVGDGPLRGVLESRGGDRIHVAGRVPHAEVPRWIAACNVLCQPSLVEPFGQAALEAMAMERSVVGTRVGGAAELVPLEAGVLVDPADVAAIADGLRAAAALPFPNEAAREAARLHDVRVQAQRMAELLERAADRGGGRR
ncbi:MAG TPA: glycosyltransferase [Solirubrobacteraceae bacterium]|nr:glycosyltransferase [Solirubrobacteraceae bacterium]